MAINLRYNYSQITRVHISLWWNTWWLMLGPGSPIHLWGCGTKPCPGCERASSCGSPQPQDEVVEVGLSTHTWDDPTYLRESRCQLYWPQDSHKYVVSWTVRFWQVIKLCLAFKSSALRLVQLPSPMCNGNKSLTAQQWQGCLAIKAVVLRPRLPF